MYPGVSLRVRDDRQLDFFLEGRLCWRSVFCSSSWAPSLTFRGLSRRDTGRGNPSLRETSLLRRVSKTAVDGEVRYKGHMLDHTSALEILTNSGFFIEFGSSNPILYPAGAVRVFFLTYLPTCSSDGVISHFDLVVEFI